jgi:2-oxoglutarate dehydrogenase E2 component (dihydrolipoamide succinyltransferase)
MSVDIKVPSLGESVTEATVAKWFKATGDSVAVDEALVELETDKVTVEVNAQVAGALKTITAIEGTDVQVDAVLGIIEEGASGSNADSQANTLTNESAILLEPKSTPAHSPIPSVKPEITASLSPTSSPTSSATAMRPLSPAVRKLVDDNNLNALHIFATGKDGRITKGDVIDYIAKGGAPKAQPQISFVSTQALPPRPADPREERIKMSRLRKIISERLKEAQNTAAMLTTWNEVDMSAVIKMRNENKEAFEKKHGVRLGFMSSFIRSACIALKEWPAVNGEIYGDEIIYKNYYNIGVAVGSPKGLVVPVLRDADKMEFAEIESGISDFGRRARDGKLGIDEMLGGTFTISNGGVFGSLNSMPILNVPQSAILGMHKIEKRAIVVSDEIVIRPMMHLALSYDHRIIDGREAVSFLVRLKECIENPERILINV